MSDRTRSSWDIFRDFQREFGWKEGTVLGLVGRFFDEKLPAHKGELARWLTEIALEEERWTITDR